jgi:hypothetical protein
LVGADYGKKGYAFFAPAEGVAEDPPQAGL